MKNTGHLLAGTAVLCFLFWAKPAFAGPMGTPMGIQNLNPSAPFYQNPYPAPAVPTSSAPTTIVPVAAVPPDHIEEGGQYYDVSVSGLSDYMDDLQGRNPVLWKKLKPDFDRLRSKRNTALWVAIPLEAAGVGLVVGSLSFMRKTDALGVKGPNGPVLLAGTGVMLVGLVAALIIEPHRSDFLHFVNRHNKLDPSHPMGWQLGFGLSPASAPMGTLSFAF